MKQSFGTTDTSISGVTAPSISCPVINFNADYRLKSSTSNETVIINTTTPFDQPESIRFGIQDIANIYQNAGLSTDQIIGSKKGSSLVIQLNTTLKTTSDDGLTVLGYFPITAHMVLKVPNSGYITKDIIQSIVARLNGVLYDQGVNNSMALLKGALNPKGL